MVLNETSVSLGIIMAGLFFLISCTSPSSEGTHDFKMKASLPVDAELIFE